MRALLGHRLSAHDGDAAKLEWYNIVEGDHPLWSGLSEPYKHTIRAFLVHFHTLVLRQPLARFDFRNGSVGTSQPCNQNRLTAHDTLQFASRTAARHS